MTELTFPALLDAVSGGAVALRSRLTLQPAGGAGDKVFPPTYAVDGRGEHKYAVEERQVGDGDSTSVTVLLDSVASQANRAEMGLLDGWERSELKFPVPYVDFSGSRNLTDYEKVTVLEAPHRIADAIFRDSLLDGTLFRLSDIGRAITDATPRDATDMYRYSPTSLLFGMWDSTGPKGGLGSKFQRAYVSEIVGFDAKVGKKVGSRIDPLQIERVAPEDRVFNSRDPNEVWTTDPDKAEKQKGKLVHATRKERERRGRTAVQDQSREHPPLDRRLGRRGDDFAGSPDDRYLVGGPAPVALQGVRARCRVRCQNCCGRSGGSRHGVSARSGLRSAIAMPPAAHTPTPAGAVEAGRIEP